MMNFVKIVFIIKSILFEITNISTHTRFYFLFEIFTSVNIKFTLSFRIFIKLTIFDSIIRYLIFIIFSFKYFIKLS